MGLLLLKRVKKYIIKFCLVKKQGSRGNTEVSSAPFFLNSDFSCYLPKEKVKYNNYKIAVQVSSVG